VLLGKVPIIGTVLVTLTAILGTYTVLEGVRIKKEADEIASIPVEVQRRSLIGEKLEKARSIIKSHDATDGVKVRSPIQRVNQENGEFIQRADKQIRKFESQERAFDTIIKLNEGGCSTTLTKNSLDVYETLVENYRRISKRIVAYATTNNEDIKVEIEKLLESNGKVLNLYNKLIEEVSRMGDNLNEQDESLQNLISDLQELRKRNEVEDDEAEEDPFKLATFPPKE
jgi:hypothetical protein